MSHFLITVRVVFDEATTPEDMSKILKKNVDVAIQNGLLTNGSDQTVVDEYSASILEIV